MDKYFENLKNPKHLADLQKLRAFLKEQLPDASEDLKYGMPTYSQQDQVVVSMASQRNHMSLYMDVELMEKYKPEMGKVDCGKSCLRFKKLDDLPLDVVKKILRETVEKQAS